MRLNQYSHIYLPKTITISPRASIKYFCNSV